MMAHRPTSAANSAHTRCAGSCGNSYQTMKTNAAPRRTAAAPAMRPPPGLSNSSNWSGGEFFITVCGIFPPLGIDQMLARQVGARALAGVRRLVELRRDELHLAPPA